MPDPEDRKFVLTDEQWERIEPHLPQRTKDNWVGRGRPWGEHRTIIEGIIYRFRVGCPWRDVPADYGVWQTIYDRFNTWSKDGTFNTILSELQADAYGNGDLEWVVSIDSSNARAHKHAAGAQPIELDNDREDSATPQQDTGGKIELQESAYRTR